MSKNAALRLLLASSMLFVPACHASSVVYFAAPTILYVGSSFDAYVGVANFPYDVGGFQFDIAYDPTVLAVTNVQEGNFLPAQGQTLFDPGITSNTAGHVSFIYDIALSNPFYYAGGALADISFNNIGSGAGTSPGSSVNTSISIENFSIFDYDGNLLSNYDYMPTAGVQFINNPFYPIPPFTPPALSLNDSDLLNSSGPSTVTPEPSTLLLLGSGLFLGTLHLWRRRLGEFAYADPRRHLRHVILMFSQHLPQRGIRLHGRV